MAAPQVEAKALETLLSELARLSGTGPGVTRLAYDPSWCAAHQWLRAQARSRGLRTWSDWAGNLLFHDDRVSPGATPPALLVGSHLDSVIHGGAFDGAYGVIAGLALAAEHAGRGKTPVVGWATCEEEGSRFDSAMFGVRALLGTVRDHELDQVRDRDGTTWRKALDDAQAAGCAAAIPVGGLPKAPALPIAGVLELHVEQGPVLESQGLSLGIVTEIAGYRRLRTRIAGEARHAGTTPMPMRRDALAAAAEMILAAESLARETSAPAVATAGFVHATPGLYNVIPGACELGLEVRHSQPELLGVLENGLIDRCRAIASRREVGFEVARVAVGEPTRLSTSMAAAAEDLARERNLPFRRMLSGAGHDSMVFAQAGHPTLMLFVPSRGGISHSPEEFTDSEALAIGIRFASELLERFGEQPDRLAAGTGASGRK